MEPIILLPSCVRCVTIISDNPISRPQWTYLAELAMILIGSLLIVLTVYYLPIWVGAVSFVASAIAVSFASYYACYEFSILLDLSASLLIYILLLTSSSFNNFYKQFVLRQQVKKQFGTYVSPDLVKQLQKDPSLLRLGGERKEMTFMFMDICGFTPISEYYKNKDAILDEPFYIINIRANSLQQKRKKKRQKRNIIFFLQLKNTKLLQNPKRVQRVIPEIKVTKETLVHLVHLVHQEQQPKLRLEVHLQLMMLQQ